ncbi:MAG: Oligosaccharyl transferase, STT3 subunit [Methanothrix harundinacea]|jgi:dolichyl-diphosphooligosaccharide--protein glycosyltransferase|uniref:dolichyl-phosphooligosaccharide-protein glycotransferase n=1 Tax=Methanothrix harundinacea TaxID=301375 RepID=A0A101FUR8_9EURY|nr:MAG: Oligosaccharyl transferase, STT3 subunit [Methanothrix harundinacea]
MGEKNDGGRVSLRLDRGGVKELASVIAVYLLGLLVRMAPLRGATIDGDILFYGSDSFYHMRRVLYTVDHFPHTLWFDSFLNYPRGLELTWPPLFDQLIAGTAILFGAESQREIEIVGAFVPPILGSMTILALYFLARELFGRRVGLISALFLAINPQHGSATIFARPDHHVLETFLLVTALLFLVLALTRNDRNLWFAAIAGVFLAAIAYTWYGAAAYFSIFLVYLLAQTAIDIRRRESSRDTTEIFSVVFGVAMILILPFWKETWMMPSFLAVAGMLLMLFALRILSHYFIRKGLHWAGLLLAVAAFGYLLYVSVYALDRFVGSYHILLSGLGYFFGGPLSQRVSEAAPLYSSVRPISVLGFNLTIAVMGFAYLWRSDIDRPQLLFLTSAVFLLFITVFQNRFLYVFSACMSILMALFFFRASEIVKSLGWFKNDDAASKFIPLALLALLILPSAANVTDAFEVSPTIVECSWNRPLFWLEENTPETFGFEDPSQVPDYGVLSWWDRGNWILYISRRPVVANGFQAGAEDAARFFLSGDEGEALRILDDRRVIYVVTDSRMVGPGLLAMALWKGEKPADYVSITDDVYGHTEKFLKTTLARCHLFDCQGMSHLRLIYEHSTEASGPSADQVKIFERVSGATISGTASDGTVAATLDLTTGQGRSFRYTKIATVRDGRYEMTVPYSTEGMGQVHAIGPYVLSSDGRVLFVDVGEEDVLQGKVVAADF